MGAAEHSHPFYKPLWRRLVIITVTALWFGYELAYSGQPLWIVLAGGMLAYALWVFLISWPRNDAKSVKEEKAP